MMSFVSGRKLNTNSRVALCDNGEEKADYINSFSKKLCCKILRQLCFIKHDRNNGMFAGFNIKTCNRYFFTEIFSVVPKLIAKFCCAAEHVNHRYGSSNNRRR